MAVSRVITFDDPEPFEAALHGVGNEVLMTGSRSFAADLTQVELSRVRLQRCSEFLPTIRVGGLSRGEFGIEFLVGAKRSDLRHCGLPVQIGDIVVDDSTSMHRRTEAPCRWASLTMQADEFAAACFRLSGHDPRSHRTRLIRPDPGAFSKLSNLHASAGRMANEAPAALNNSRVAQALDEALATTLVRCLVDEEQRQVRIPCGRSLIARLEDFLAEHPDEPIYIGELCAATHATERMLRAACHEHLGMSAIRYLRLRRMHMAHRLLLSATQPATVTEVAMQCGFWELGRFAVQYRALFGETPSATLRRVIRRIEC